MRNTDQISMLLIDDDPSFCHILSSAAKGVGIEVDQIQNLIELQGVVKLPDYDIVLLDFDLGAGTGFDVADFIASLSGELPILMVTGKKIQQLPMHRCPNSIKKYISKAEGYQTILKEVKKIVTKKPIFYEYYER